MSDFPEGEWRGQATVRNVETGEVTRPTVRVGGRDSIGVCRIDEAYTMARAVLVRDFPLGEVLALNLEWVELDDRIVSRFAVNAARERVSIQALRGRNNPYADTDLARSLARKLAPEVYGYGQTIILSEVAPYERDHLLDLAGWIIYEIKGAP